MYLRELKISKHGSLIRKITFRPGLNFIVDKTDPKDRQTTGNNVGKTTVLKVIDFCFGADGKNIYTSSDSGKTADKETEDFLYGNAVDVELTLSDSFEPTSKLIILERNFAKRNKAVRKIDGVDYGSNNDAYCDALLKRFFPESKDEKPTFRQLISHYIRYSNLSVENTIKYLDSFTRNEEYEALYLFMFGCPIDNASKTQELQVEISQEKAFQKKLEVQQTKEGFVSVLAVTNEEIRRLTDKKDSFNLNEHFKDDVDELSQVKLRLGALSYEINSLKTKLSLIRGSLSMLDQEKADIDISELKSIYEEAGFLQINVEKSFDELVSFHNSMVENKKQFLQEDLPDLEAKLSALESELPPLLKRESDLTSSVKKNDSIETLNGIIEELNKKYQEKGSLEETIKQITDSELRLVDLCNKLKDITNGIYTDEFANKLREKINDFNTFFSDISFKLYSEKYLLKYDVVKPKNSEKSVYTFATFTQAYGSGKKQGEILAFDLAYREFADKNGISHFDFLLNDKKELMHDNQLIDLKEYLDTHPCQVVLSMLKDKIPTVLAKDEFFCVELSQQDKLFRF
jgi:uncharacterized protein YydD (DUF2326 family)